MRDGRRISCRMTNNVFPCFRCGCQNSVGTPFCGHCHQHFYYTCPQCNAWVNNAFVTCPRCFMPLNWPARETMCGAYTGATGYVPGQAGFGEERNPKKKGALSTILLLLFVGGLLIIGFDLVTNNSNASPSSSQAPVNAMPISNTQQAVNAPPSIKTPAPAVTLSPLPDITPTPTPTATQPSYPASTQNTITEFSLPATTVTNVAATSSSSQYTPGQDSYLQQLDPGWGHCSGGSCRQQ